MSFCNWEWEQNHKVNSDLTNKKKNIYTKAYFWSSEFHGFFQDHLQYSAVWLMLHWMSNAVSVSLHFSLCEYLFLYCRSFGGSHFPRALWCGTITVLSYSTQPVQNTLRKERRTYIFCFKVVDIRRRREKTHTRTHILYTALLIANLDKFLINANWWITKNNEDGRMIITEELDETDFIR